MTDQRVGPLAVHLLRGFLLREESERRFQDLLKVQDAVRDFLRVIGVELVVDETEGFAYVRQGQSADDEDAIPRLVRRTPLGFTASLLLALLRKRLGEHDATTGETRLLLSREQVIDLIRGFIPNQGDDTKLISQAESAIEQVVRLNFLRPIQDRDEYEVRRILIAFINAQWLNGLAAGLEAYRRRATAEVP